MTVALRPSQNRLGSHIYEERPQTVVPFGTSIKAGSQQAGMQIHGMSSVKSSSKRLVQQEQANSLTSGGPQAFSRLSWLAPSGCLAPAQALSGTHPWADPACGRPAPAGQMHAPGPSQQEQLARCALHTACSLALTGHGPAAPPSIAQLLCMSAESNDCRLEPS